MSSTFEFYRQPLEHQRRTFERSKDADAFGIFYEQRCGKTKVVYDTAVYRYLKNDVDALVVVAWPNGVQHVWVEEAAKDVSPVVPTRVLAWRSGKMTNRAGTAALDELASFEGLAVLALNCEALLTEACWSYLRKFFRKRRVMLVADESEWMKTSGAARTKRALAMSRAAPIRRILSGTPADEGPFDLYSQTNFLRPALLGFTSFTAFKSRYGRYETDAFGNRVKGYNRATGTQYDQLIGYQNLEELNAKLARFSDRVRRADVSDAPPKVYQSRYFSMTPRQRSVYDRLRDEYEIELRGADVPVAHVLTRLTRLQMVARNYHPPEKIGVGCTACGGEGYLGTDECVSCGGIGIRVETTVLTRIDPDRNPAQEALIEELLATRHPVVVWARFRQDVTDALEAARIAGRSFARFDGTVSDADRESAYRAFRAGEVDGIAATIGSGLTRGRDLTRAGTLIYYSNSYALRDRGQSEDRAEALAREVGTGIVDLIAEGTNDLATIEALRAKRSIAEIIMGDPARGWL